MNMNPNKNNDIKIAIIDDHELIRECLFTCLTQWGYSVVIQASNGKDFLDKISEDNLPDICVLDLSMPVLNGYKTIPILKKTWPSIKILVFSMNITKETPGNYLNADAVLSKSEGINEIKKVLQLLSIPNTVSQ
jgi:DNA-binding NarL/FixJ family response regulator